MSSYSVVFSVSVLVTASYVLNSFVKGIFSLCSVQLEVAYRVRKLFVSVRLICLVGKLVPRR